MDLQLEAGRFYAILGRNGSGKSTLMRILAHREAASGGEAEVLGVRLEDDFAERASEIAFVAEGSLYPAPLALAEIFPFYRAAFPGWSEDLARGLLGAFGLGLEKRVGELSRGQLVQLAVSLQLAYGPRLILLDEVTSVLDAKARGTLLKELRARVAGGATVLLSTNIVTEVQGIADSFVLLGDKRVKISAPAAELAESFIKLRRSLSDDHPVFGAKDCVEVGLGDGGTPLFLLSKEDAALHAGCELFIAREAITASEVFIYLSSLRE